ncbi:serine/threonine protein kinase [Bryobacterales bacterium F-183]|nr:serine/threonine protein kinase [Bryobacterales bacterium F-183]
MTLTTSALLFALLSADQNWPSFRGPSGTGVQQTATPPLQFSGKEGTNLAWKTPIPGLSVASPIVWGNRVIVVTAISSDPQPFRHGLYGDVEPSKDVAKHTWKVYALDRSTGKIVWEQVASEGAPKTKRHPKSSQATCTPATDGKYVAVWFGSEGLFVFDFATGKPLWKKDLGLMNAGWFYDPDYEWGVGASPVIYKDSVIVQADIQKNSFLAAFDVKTGKEKWRTSRDEIPSWGTPTVYEGKAGAEIITNGTNALRGYDFATGKELWSISGEKFNSEITIAVPYVADDLIYISAGYPPAQPIFAIKPGVRGKVTVTDAPNPEVFAWKTKRGGPYIPTSIVYQGILYTVQNNGILAAYEAKTGKRLYQNRVSTKSSAHSAAPVAADGKLYFAAEDGDVFVVKAGPTFELLASNEIGEVLMATPAIVDNMLIVRGQNHVFAFTSAASK